jgi:ssDNA-binding Zn-finger/Zn-ribbon topoisomerase 1
MVPIKTCELKNVGGRLMGSCPACGKQAFIVFPDKNRWSCYVCLKSGSAFEKENQGGYDLSRDDNKGGRGSSD